MAFSAYHVAAGVAAVILHGIVFGLAAWGLLKLLLGPFIVMVSAGGLTAPNHADEAVPYSVGVLPVLAACLVIMATRVETGLAFYVVSGTVIATLVGLLDDVAGNRTARGLHGHLTLMAQGRLSTGGWKAIVISITAVIAGTSLARGWWGLMDAALIALTTNFINLLDVRPGRAAKGLLLFFLVALLFGLGRGPYELLFPFLGVLLAYAPADLSARAMLGDSGANGLGFAAGLCVVFTAPLLLRIALTVALLLLHFISERRSLSGIIDDNRWLRAVDRWGR